MVEQAFEAGAFRLDKRSPEEDKLEPRIEVSPPSRPSRSRSRPGVPTHGKVDMDSVDRTAQYLEARFALAESMLAVAFPKHWQPESEMHIQEEDHVEEELDIEDEAQIQDKEFQELAGTTRRGSFTWGV